MTSGLTAGAHPAPLHPQESLRLQALNDLLVLDTLPEPMFDDIALLASQICGTPVALISLIDSERQWFKAKVGIDVAETPRELAFCAHAILEPDQVLVVDNALEDARFATNPLVTDNPHIRFYAGAPIVTPDGLPVGTVCAIDREPRHITEAQTRSLQALSRQVARMLSFRRASMARIEAVEHALSAREEEALRLMSFAAADLDVKSFVDRHYVYRAVNGAYLRHWGRDIGDVVGKSVAAVRGASVFETQFKPLIDRALGGESSSFEVSSIYPAKGLRRMQVRVVPARSSDGDVVGVVIDEHDIQDLADAAQKLRDTIGELEKRTLTQHQFIYMLSHDLSGPINTIIHLSNDLEKGLTDSAAPDVLQFAQLVHAGGTQAKALLDDLLEYLRLEQHVVHRQAVDLNTLASDVLNDLRDTLQRTTAVVTCRPLPPIEGDARLLRVVMQNLISNAVKFVSPGVTPLVSLYAQDSAGSVRLCVQDNGVGVPAANHAQLFQLSKRLNRRKDNEGLGMGLATCRRIAEMHGGTMGVSSTVGRGSCFWIELPKPSGS